MIVVETTGTSRSDFMSGLDDECGRRVEYINYVPSADEAQRGKGAVELRAIDDAIDQLLVGMGDETLFKLTGRLIVSNLSRLLIPLPPQTLVARGTLDRTWFDTRLLGARVSLWKDSLCRASALCNDRAGVYVEKALAAQIARDLVLGRIDLVRFPQQPAFSGQSGSTGTTYRGPHILTSLRHTIYLPLESALSRISSRKQI
ncbi:hypothetical protein RM52_04005 [Microbacterium hominis]|uniref:Uncharacterized protein n=1 Tax=Microbacterium hominis TaxID=162426 RepID=A0A0B4D5A3_9MICO|nr:hypothetical protein RM52_04005 [Microbacterium hominis]